MPNKSAKQKQNANWTENDEQYPEKIEVDGERSGCESFRSNYVYQSQPSKQIKSKKDATIAQLAEGISDLVKIFKANIPPPIDENPMVNKTALANIDRMLQKLKPDVVEDLLFEMTSLVYSRIKDPRYRN